MRKVLFFLALIMVLALAFAAFGGTAYASPNDKACWGQASAVFAQMGKMGEHSSNPPPPYTDNPRLGLRNLARLLYDLGAIPDDSMQALGVFVATELELTIEACGTSFP
jgi:hypothetical protein